jgi:hypothetical protein
VAEITRVSASKIGDIRYWGILTGEHCEISPCDLPEEPEQRLSTSSDEEWHDTIAQPKGPRGPRTASRETLDACSAYEQDIESSSNLVSSHLELDQWDGIVLRPIHCHYIEPIIAQDTTGARQILERFLPRRDTHCLAEWIVVV